MNRLGITAIIAAIAGAIVIVGAVIARGQVYGHTSVLATPDYSAVILWTYVGVSLLGIAILAGLLSMLAAEIRAAIRDTRSN